MMLLAHYEAELVDACMHWVRRYWLVFGGAGSVWGCTGWYLVAKGRSNLVLGTNNLVPIGIKWYWYRAFIPVYIERKKVDKQ